MKRNVILLLLMACWGLSCSKSNNSNPASMAQACGNYKNGQQLHKGSDGGCYYINSNGNKTYVERSACTCN